jgi:hypothetical protein
MATKEYNRQYYLTHKEETLERVKKWKKENKEKTKEYIKKYYKSEIGKQKKKEQNRRYRENKTKLLELKEGK